MDTNLLDQTRSHYDSFPFIEGGANRIAWWREYLRAFLPDREIQDRLVLDVGSSVGEISRGMIDRGARLICLEWGIHFIQVHPMGCGLAAPEQECEIARIVRVAAKPTHTRIHCGGSLRAATPRIGRATQPHAAPEQ